MTSESPASPPSPIAFPIRLAAIDIGSNALRFTAADFSAPGDFQPVESRRFPVRLGQAAFRSHRLEAERIQQAVAAIGAFRDRISVLGVHHYRAVATSAVRESDNGSELVERVRAMTGIEVEAITGREEGELVWRAIRARLSRRGGRWLLADLGGGSLELSLAESDNLRWTESLPLGTVRLLDAVEGKGEGAIRTLQPLIEEAAAGHPLDVPVEAMIATGGNADVLADLAGVPADDRGVRQLPRRRLHQLIDQLAALSVRERIQQLGLREDRADVIFPAAIVYERLASIARIETIIVPGVGLKEGVMLDLMDDLARSARAGTRATAL